MHPGIAIIALWILWALSWIAAAGWTNRTEKKAELASQAGYRIVLIGGGLVLAMPAHGYSGTLRFWHVNWIEAWACVMLIALGFGFCWWARIHLGRFWSSQVTRKSDHRVIDTGPYAMVRHPIYTGILCAVYATAAAKGTLFGVCGAAIITTGIWMKARLEESWLSQELGRDYDGYRLRVPMLLPFGPKPRNPSNMSPR
jgi:protein-S-isoprenylcysteine O-methyltransferase Ste14